MLAYIQPMNPLDLKLYRCAAPPVLDIETKGIKLSETKRQEF
jgi:hypothetical protein